MRVSGCATRMSAPDSSWNPPPIATPCTAAITGTGNSRQPVQTNCASLDGPRLRSDSFSPEPPPAIDAMSSPAQKARPSPDSTTARTSGIVPSRSIASRRPANIAGSSAFILSARVSRTSAIPSATVIETRSFMVHPLPKPCGLATGRARAPQPADSRARDR